VKLQVFDGTTGVKVSEEMLPTLKPGVWYQRNAVLGSTQNGYCRLTVVNRDRLIPRLWRRQRRKGLGVGDE